MGIKKVLKTLSIKSIDWLIDAAPQLFCNSIMRRYPEIIIQQFNTPISFQLPKTNLPKEINGFEDLVNLFWCTLLNRGVLRQDIDEASALYRVVNNTNPVSGVEIGRYYGASTILLAAAVGPGGCLLSIDIAPKDDLALRTTLTDCQLSDRVELMTGNANTIDHKNKIYDFAFIDGDHSYDGARNDHNKWGSRVKINGHIIHHDMGLSRNYATQICDLARLRTDILQKQSNVLEMVKEVGSMCIFKRISSSWTPL